ncbi:hypothetical protein NYP18_04305 [Corynebacterium sp. YIM 101645]|uniref:Uncharacterized protein n=1 Tax=Corynebacterium lemuris TaxID=1859292 RepID=A0ABT2FUG4_9CORY|nr:hypothetical protein [Corynebacterium lemuris]MCS5478875.1 hypothetical protein [Corynebacterium lemuris]
MSGERIVRTDFSRGEAVGGLVWLSVAALIAVLLQVVYLGTWVTLPGGFRVAVPYTIVLAFLFNMVLTRTAKLWSPRPAFAAVPLYAWLAGFLLLLSGVVVTGDQLVGDNIRTVLLLFAGVAGGVWPLVRGK